jgi:hypothetical protein
LISIVSGKRMPRKAFRNFMLNFSPFFARLVCGVHYVEEETWEPLPRPRPVVIQIIKW